MTRDKGTGTITRLPSGSYRCQLPAPPDPDTGRRRRATATGRTRKEALDNARAKLPTLDAPTDTATPTVAEWCDQWVEHVIKPRRAPNTYRAYRTRIDTTITPRIGHIRLDRLRPSHLRRLEQADRSGATARLTRTVLTQALDDAVREGMLDRNPADGLDTPALDITETRILTPDQAHRLIGMEPDPMWRLIWRLQFTTGMRIGETLALTPRELTQDMGRVCIHVAWQLKRFSHIENERDLPRGFEARHLTGHIWMTRPKTRRGRRLIPLPDQLGADLTAYACGRDPDTLLFRSARGNPLGREAARVAWNRALERARLPHVTIHSARHTAATIMAEAGVSDLIRKRLIGHANIDTTDMVYTHTDTLRLADAIDQVARALS